VRRRGKAAASPCQTQVVDFHDNSRWFHMIFLGRMVAQHAKLAPPSKRHETPQNSRRRGVSIGGQPPWRGQSHQIKANQVIFSCYAGLTKGRQGTCRDMLGLWVIFVPLVWEICRNCKIRSLASRKPEIPDKNAKSVLLVSEVICASLRIIAHQKICQSNGSCWPAGSRRLLTPRPSRRKGRWTRFSRPRRKQPSR
jgi:hypothetical protein